MTSLSIERTDSHLLKASSCLRSPLTFRDVSNFLVLMELSPCIMCVQYRGGYSVRWGISWVPWGDILSTVGDIMINVGISWVPWGCSVLWGISWVPWGFILSTVGDVQYHGDIMMHVGGYHEYRGGCSVPWGDTILWNLSTLGGYHGICGGISWVPWGVFSTVGYSNNKRFSPHGTEHPPRYSWYLTRMPHGWSVKSSPVFMSS